MPAPANTVSRPRLSLTAVLERRRLWTRSALGVRAVVLACGAATMLVPGHQRMFLLVLTGLGVLVAVGSPARGGAALAIGSAIADWVAGYGLDAAPPVIQTLGLAAALYLLHSSTALAAAVPLRCELRAAPVLGWIRRSALHLAVGGLFAAASYTVGRLPSSPALDLAALIGAVALIALVVLLFSRTPKP